MRQLPVTLGFLLLRFTTLEKFQRRAIAKRLVRTYGVVDVFLAAKLGIEMGDAPTVGNHLIELLVMRAMRAFHLPVQLGRTRRQDKKRQATLLADVSGNSPKSRSNL